MANAKRRGGSGALAHRYQSLKVHSTTEIGVMRTYFESLDTPTSLACWLLFEASEFDQLVSKEIEPSHYKDALSFKLDFAAISFCRKHAGLKTSFDTKQRAIDGFILSEEKCAKTNHRFRNLALDPSFTGSNVWLLNATTRKIASILGKYDPDEFFSNGSWGPGATISITGVDTSPVRKFRYERQITNELYGFISPFLVDEYPMWFPTQDVVEKLERVNASKLLTVPKNAKIDRTIAIEPGLNTWFQKSVGKSIRNRLRRNGVDLNSSAKNEDLARTSSKDGACATVDFSAASDTISKLLVREILPADWFVVLNSCRTPCYSTSGERLGIPLEKFSSMGNGFTFELESLIFYSAACAVSEYFGLDSELVSVFGDDITIDVRCYDLYRSFTEFLGFTVNNQKSFSNGYFRESCGSYYYDGVDVKPLFLKGNIRDAKSIFKLANGISRVAHRDCYNHGRSLRYFPVHSKLVELIPKDLRLFGCSTSGDSCIHGNMDESTPALAEYGWEGYLHSAFVESSVSQESDSPSVLLTRLWYPSRDQDYGNSFDLRSVTKVRVKRIFVQQWYNFGPWR